MTDISNDELKSVWRFYNKCFLGRYYPRHTLKHFGRKPWQSYKFKCYTCGLIKKGNRYRRNAQKGTKSRSIYDCSECHKKEVTRELKLAQSENRVKSIETANRFSNVLKDCTKNGTCDILAAHHEAFKDDPERLSTDFLVGLICGDQKLKRYRND